MNIDFMRFKSKCRCCTLLYVRIDIRQACGLIVLLHQVQTAAIPVDKYRTRGCSHDQMRRS